MNRNQVKTKLKNKFGELLDIFPKELKKEVEASSFIAGGSIPSLFLNEEPNDYDIFFKDQSTLNKVEKYLDSTDALEKLVLFKSPNAITLAGKYQLIKKIVGLPAVVIKDFDFAHCSCYYEPSSDAIVVHELAFESMASRNLVYVGSKYPFASLIRTKKFIKRGWNITAGQMLKLCLELQKVDLTNLEALKEQLMGVDLSYVSDMLANLGTLGTIGFNSGMVIDLIERTELTGEEFPPVKKEDKEDESPY